jgi:hypothetical protein
MKGEMMSMPYARVIGRRTSFIFRDTDYEKMDKIKKYFGLTTRTDAIKLSLELTMKTIKNFNKQSDEASEEKK